MKNIEKRVFESVRITQGMALAPVLSVGIVSLMREFRFSLNPLTFALFILLFKYLNLSLYFFSIYLPIRLFDTSYFKGDLLNSASIHSLMMSLEETVGGRLIEQTLFLPFLYQGLKLEMVGNQLPQLIGNGFQNFFWSVLGWNLYNEISMVSTILTDIIILLEPLSDALLSYALISRIRLPTGASPSVLHSSQLSLYAATACWLVTQFIQLWSKEFAEYSIASFILDMMLFGYLLLPNLTLAYTL